MNWPVPSFTPLTRRPSKRSPLSHTIWPVPDTIPVAGSGAKLPVMVWPASLIVIAPPEERCADGALAAEGSALAISFLAASTPAGSGDVRATCGGDGADSGTRDCVPPLVPPALEPANCVGDRSAVGPGD